MRFLPHTSLVLLLGLSTGALAFQGGGFRQFGLPIGGYETAGDSKHEFAWSRLRYPALGGSFGGFGFSRGSGAWSRDYPKADIVFLAALRRLTRIDARSYQQVVDLDHDDIFNYPFMYAVQVETWTFSEEQAKRLREYLLKGGFLMVDDFHGTADWESFLRGMRMVLPAERYAITDLEDADEIFHVLYDIKHIPQIPSINFWEYSGGQTSERGALSAEPHVRAIMDDDGRIMVLMTHNTDFGDAFEREGDDHRYFLRFAPDGYAFGVNALIYSMTH
jgi:hypothetical protein